MRVRVVVVVVVGEGQTLMPEEDDDEMKLTVELRVAQAFFIFAAIFILFYFPYLAAALSSGGCKAFCVPAAEA